MLKGSSFPTQLGQLRGYQQDLETGRWMDEAGRPLFFVTSPKLGIAMCRKFEELTALHLVFVIKKDTHYARSYFLNHPNTVIEKFTYHETLLGAPFHHHARRYRKVSPEEQRALVRRFGPVKHFPLLRASDVIIRWYRFRPGDIIHDPDQPYESYHRVM